LRLSSIIGKGDIVPKICFEIDRNLKRRFDRWWMRVQKEAPEERGIASKDEWLADLLEDALDNYEP
jgi:hypothetical protein